MVWCDFHADQLLYVPHSSTNVHRGIRSDRLELGDAPSPRDNSDNPSPGKIYLYEDDGQELSAHSLHDDRRLGGLSLPDEAESTDYDLLC